MMRKLSPMRGNPLYLIMGKSQNTPLAHGMDERQTGFWGGNLHMAFSLEEARMPFGSPHG